MENNGFYGIEYIRIFPVFDSRNPKAWDSIARVFQESLPTYSNDWKIAGEPNGLLPFAEFGTGDFICFDYGKIEKSNEPIVILWDHEGRPNTFLADSFSDFLERSDEILTLLE